MINQEDLAAILPDVVPAADDGGCGAPFDGFEDVSSESGKAAQRGTESSSDVELPEQVTTLRRRAGSASFLNSELRFQLVQIPTS